MNILLRSLSHPQLNALSIDDSFFLIGRDQPPFVSLGGAVDSGLAVQHACIFRVENEFYLIDFGAGAAIRHNNRALPPKRPIKLANHDELWFAEGFGFRIERDDRDAPATARLPIASVQLALLPAPDSVAGETVIHGVPPLLIGRDMMMLAAGASAAPAAIKTLSRYHALLFLKGESLYVMDLGSTNGTWLGEDRISPYTELPLSGGDNLAFGNSRLRYTVQVRRTDDNDQAIGQEFDDELTANSSGLYHVGKTVYIKAANSFLKMLTDLPADDESIDQAKEKTDLSTPVIQSPLGKARAFYRELREALGSERPRRRTGLVVAAVAVAIALAAGLYFHNAPRREIKTLISQGEYQAGLERASMYLRRHPDDAEVSTLALEALVRDTVPRWQAEIEAGRFDAAADRLREIQAEAIPDSGTLLGLLEWIGDLQRFLAGRGGRDAPLKLFQDEQTIAALLERWDAVARDYELLSLKIADWAPAFQEPRRQALSQQRLLRNEQAVYLKAITELEQALRQMLAQGNTDEALAYLERFTLQYPRIRGLDPLRADIAQFETLRRAAKDQDLGNLLDWRKVAFTTSWVGETATRWLEEQLPPPEMLESYKTALAAWQVGNVRQAMALLQPLLQDRGGPIIAVKLAHFQQVADAFEQLKTARGQPDYSERLLKLSHGLHPAEDRFFVDALAEDLRVQRQALATQAKTLFQQAASHWGEYQRRGGITGLMRLEQTVSQPFRQQAQRLAQAHATASGGARYYDLLREIYPETARRLHDDILAETRRQRQSLADLRLVMQPTLLDAKLQLLPEPGTSPP
jgi:pSer/pThr/pTyr-binding forkhead associated (FHA) protein